MYARAKENEYRESFRTLLLAGTVRVSQVQDSPLIFATGGSLVGCFTRLAAPEGTCSRRHPSYIMNGRDLTRTGVVGSLIETARSFVFSSIVSVHVFSREKHSLLGGRGF